MRTVAAGAFALAVTGASLAPAAWAQEAQLNWVNINTPAGSAAAWAMKPAATPEAKPQVLVLMRSATPGAPGTDMRTSTMFTLEADCAAGKTRPLAHANYGADFIQMSAPAVNNQWGTFAEYGEYGAIVQYACQMKNPPVLWQADIKGAQQKLDATIPKPKIPITPPVNATFEYLGDSGNSTQPIQYWLDTASIARQGNIAKVWKLEVWESAFTRIHNFPPITWRLYEIECAAMLRYRNVFWRQLGSDLSESGDTERPDAKFSTGGDPSTDAMMKRVCNNRPLLFSHTIKGDLKTLVSKRFPGASEKLVSGIPWDKPPPVQQVDLGPTLRIEEGDANWKYKGTFTRQSPESSYYVGVMQAEGIDNPNRTTFNVRGIIDGKLVIERIGTPQGDMAIPVTNGKTSGKGIAWWERDDDAYSWKLAEPATITVK